MFFLGKERTRCWEVKKGTAFMVELAAWFIRDKGSWGKVSPGSKEGAEEYM